MFDPYHKWLGILSNDQSVTHYRLLGLEPFESDLDVIDGAADRQMSCVRQYQSGEHATDASRLLNELAAARLCLLKAETKAAYDATLLRELQSVEPDAPETPATVVRPNAKRRSRKGSKPTLKSQSAQSSQPLIIGGLLAVAVVILAVFVVSARSKPLLESPSQEVATAAASAEIVRPASEVIAREGESVPPGNADMNEPDGRSLDISQSDAPAVASSADVQMGREETPLPQPTPIPTEIATGPGEKRASIPSTDRQIEIRKLLYETYGLSKATDTAKKQKALKELMDVAENAATSTDQLYVVLEIALPLLKETNDFAQLRKAVDQLTERFDVDAESQRIKHVSEFLAACKTKTAFDRVWDDVLVMVQDAARANRYKEAQGLLAATDAAAVRLMAKNATQPLADASKAVVDREDEFKRHVEAQKILAENPEDPKASQIVGRWLAVYEESWPEALPYLAKSDDPNWKSAASEELSSPGDADAALAIADKWWKVAEASEGAPKFVVQVYANAWYSTAARDLKNPIQKAHVAKRQSQLNKDITASEPKFAKWRSKVTPPPIVPGVTMPESTATPTGEWIDLLEWAEGVEWAARGTNWNESLEGSPTRNGISLKPTHFNRFPLPAIIDGDYELEAEFTRTEGRESVDLFFPVGTRMLQLELGALAGTVAGVHGIDGKYPLDSTAGNPTTRRPSTISNNQKHRVQIRVHRDGDKAEFAIDWDDAKDYIQWEGAYSSLWNINVNPWRLSMIRHVWLGSFVNRVTFHKLRVRMTSGEIKRDVITESDRKQDLANGFVRLVGEKANAQAVGWARFLVNQYPHDMTGSEITERTWPFIARDFGFCKDFYGAHAPSRLKCPVPRPAKSFSVVGYNDSSRTTKFQVWAEGKQLYDSGLSDLSLIKIDLPPRTLMLELVVDNTDDETFDRSYWCYPRFHTVSADKITDKMVEAEPGNLKFAIASSSVRYGTSGHNTIDFSSSAPVHFRDVIPCDEFLFAHAPSTVTYAVPEGMSRFTAVGYNVRSHHVKFEIWADGRRIYESPVAGIVPIDLPLPPRTKSLELKITDLGHFANDYSMWCYPRLHRK